MKEKINNDKDTIDKSSTDPKVIQDLRGKGYDVDSYENSNKINSADRSQI